MSEIDDSVEDLLEDMKASQIKPGKPDARPAYFGDSGDDVESFAKDSGLKPEQDIPDIVYPWMAHHNFVLVQTVEEVNALVDAAIASGRASLDLETQGLDNRIYYNAEGKPETVNKIVGFCIAYGDAKEGYYIPVRHRPDNGAASMNVEPVEEVEAAITRLCKAAQPVMPPGVKDPLAGKDWLEPPKVIIDFWHASFDQEFLYPVTGVDYWHPDGFEDGNLAAFVFFTADKNLGLKAKAKELLKDPDGNPYEMIELKELLPRKKKLDFSILSPGVASVLRYAGSDAICTRLLGNHPKVVGAMTSPKFAGTYRLEKQTAQVKRVMERNRVWINKDKVRTLLATAIEQRDTAHTNIVQLAASKGFPNFEPGSTKQLSDFLFTPAGLNIEPKPETNEASGQYKTDAETFRQMVEVIEVKGAKAPPVLQWVLDFREHEKLIGTYLEHLVANGDESGEFRFSFKQTGAETGRFSAPGGKPSDGYSGLPIHGMPATQALRECFEARPGYLMVKCDYAAEELRIVTDLSGEKVWIDEFENGDGDLHSITARAFFNKKEVTKEERKMGKVANFALVYGGGPQAIMRATGCDKVEAQRRKQAFDKAVPTFAEWVKRQQLQVKKDLGVVTAFGRWIAIPDAAITEGQTDSLGRVVDAELAKKIRAACERGSINYPIQGSGADIMKIAMVLVHKEFYKRRWLRSSGEDIARMLLTVHDEIVFEIRKDKVLEALDIITEAMERPSGMPKRPVWRIPLVTEPLVGKSWGATTGCHRYTAKDDGKMDGKTRLGNWVFPLGGEKKIEPWLIEILESQGSEWVVDGTSAPPPASSAPRSSDPPRPAPTPPPRPAAPAPRPASSSPPSGPIAGQIVTIRLNKLTPHTNAQVRMACMGASNRSGPRLRLLCAMTGATLIDPTLNIRVNPDEMSKLLFDYNLSDGGYALT